MSVSRQQLEQALLPLVYLALQLGRSSPCNRTEQHPEQLYLEYPSSRDDAFAEQPRRPLIEIEYILNSLNQIQ